MDDAFGHWFAGFVDGEGSFSIRRPNGDRNDAHACSLVIGLRDDDRHILEEIQRRTGCGRITTGSVNPAQRRPNPLATWTVQARAECVRIVELLDRFPLRAKKKSDYEIWREAVAVWAERDWERMAELRSQLRAGRAYVPQLSVVA